VQTRGQHTQPKAWRTWPWGLIAVGALLWPDPISGPADGVPLDHIPEAILIAGVLPALWYFHAGFLRSTRARACIVALVSWRIVSALVFVQDGWCVRFDPARQLTKDATGAPHAWDMRADWRSPDPACSAIMTRSYHELAEFPAWFFNLPPPNESWPAPADRPPGATVAMHVHGFLGAPADGVLAIEAGPDVAALVSVDGTVVRGPALVARGLHFVAVDAVLTGDRWALVPRWNGNEIWSHAITTVRRPSRVDLAARPWSRWIPAAAAGALILLWLASAIAEIGGSSVLAWSGGASLLLAWLVLTDRVWLARWAIAGLVAAALVPVPARLRNTRGAFAMIGAPWIAFVLACSHSAVGRFVIYDFGHDTWMYQRFAYRIVMQGYWLEGGTATFYFQPLYRWIVGLLHVVFGDSSVGEWHWDGTCLLASAILSFRITHAFAGFRWGLVAAATTLAVFVLGTGQYLIGAGLSEISSAGLVSMAALCAIRSRHRNTWAAIGAGMLATLAFYTRLNNLILAAGVALFAWPLRLPVKDVIQPESWRRRVSWRTLVIVPAIVGLGVLAFMWRTWHYTGVFSLFYGTSRIVVAIWQPGAPISDTLQRLFHSIMTVLTVNDPPRFDVYALPVMIGAAVAVLSVVGTPGLRDLPAPAVLFFFAAIASAFVVAGWAYPGRFSIHVLPITSALAVCGTARLWNAVGSSRRT
jgi:hypothetical protein